MSTMLSAPQRAHIEQLLSVREAALRGVLAGEAEAVPHEHDREDMDDFKDAADEEARANLENVLADHAARELGEIAAARRRLAEGSYGTCLYCGEPIDARRLEAIPAAALCTECQANME